MNKVETELKPNKAPEFKAGDRVEKVASSRWQEAEWGRRGTVRTAHVNWGGELKYVVIEFDGEEYLDDDGQKWPNPHYVYKNDGRFRSYKNQIRHVKPNAWEKYLELI